MNPRLRAIEFYEQLGGGVINDSSHKAARYAVDLLLRVSKGFGIETTWRYWQEVSEEIDTLKKLEDDKGN